MDEPLADETPATARQRAYAAFDGGDLDTALREFQPVLAASPDDHALHYMLGLVCKYRRDWKASQRHTLEAIRLAPAGSDLEAECWNVAIAATASGDWPTARAQWAALGIGIPAGDGPIDGDFGVASFRINPWGAAETLYGQRIDPVRARLQNVPFPESGFRYGDIVLNDGAQTGTRRWGEQTVPVLNVLQRLEQSPFDTFEAWVQCDAEADADALELMTGPGIGLVEDWTRSTTVLCRKCSYGLPHDHDTTGQGSDGWRVERRFGIAAQSQLAVEALLERWQAGARRPLLQRITRQPSRARRVESIELRDFPLSEPTPGTAWWRGEDSAAD